MWKQCESLQATIVDLRRQLHQIPEVGTDLPKTQALICETLESWGIPYEKSSLDSAVFGEIKGGKPGQTILLLDEQMHIDTTIALGRVLMRGGEMQVFCNFEDC